MSAFSKFSVRGPGSEEWLNSLVANQIPKGIGRVGLIHLLTKRGGVRSEFTVFKRGHEDYYLVSAGAMERHDWDYLV